MIAFRYILLLFFVFVCSLHLHTLTYLLTFPTCSYPLYDANRTIPVSVIQRFTTVVWLYALVVRAKTATCFFFLFFFFLFPVLEISVDDITPSASKEFRK